MNCKAIVGLLVAYMDKEVTPEEQEQIQAHLAACPRCREELMALTATRDELRQALRLKAAEVAPSPQAWARLQQRLEFISRPSFWEKLSRLVPRSTIWRAVATTAVVVILALVGAVWFMGGRSAPPPSVIPQPALELEATTEKTTYLPGETIEIELTFINMTDKPIIISPFPPEIEIILPQEEEVEVAKKFAAGSGQAELKRGGEITHTLVWDQRDSIGQPVTPGYYNLNIDVNDIRIDGKGIGGMGICAEVLIQLPQGAMEKTIDLNQSQTVKGIMVTLERIELTSSGMTVYAFGTLSGYTVPPGITNTSHPMEHALAEYSVDSDIVKQAGSAGMQYPQNGTRLIWSGHVDPVPSDAKELIFRINTLTLRFAPDKPDELVVGPWEFKIPLE